MSQLPNDNLFDQPAKKLLTVFQFVALGEQAALAVGRQDIDHVGTKHLSTVTSREVIPTLRNLKPLNIDDAYRWVDYWAISRFIETNRARSKL